MPGSYLALHPRVQRLVRFKRLGGRLDAPIYDVLPRFMLAQLGADANRLAHALKVERLLEVVVVQQRLRVGIRGLELELAGAKREVEPDYHTHADGRHSVAAAVNAIRGVDVHIDDHIVFHIRAGGGVAQPELNARAECLQVVLRLGAPGYIHQRMVAQVLPHAGQVFEDGDAQFAQMVGGADAGQHQDLGRAHRAAAEYDFAAFHHEPFAAALNIHADCAIAVEDDAMHNAVGADGEVEAVAGQAEIAQVGAPADAFRVVQGQRPYACSIGRIVVGAVGEAVV